MTISYDKDSHIKPVDISIKQIDIKGQYIQLAAPIHLSGQLNIPALINHYGLSEGADNKQPIIQIGVDEAGRGPLLGSVGSVLFV